MAGWRSIWEERGAQSAAMDGGMRTLLWPVDSWAEGERAYANPYIYSNCPDIAPLQQRTWTQVQVLLTFAICILLHKISLRNLTRWNLMGTLEYL